ncbi:MAG: hypothetical protein Q4C46_09265 [Bacillota bacterium]|nr:hypothetical protein [Bacillota bacterium]
MIKNNVIARKTVSILTALAMIIAGLGFLVSNPQDAYADDSVTVKVTVKNETFTTPVVGRGDPAWTGNLFASNYEVTLSDGQTIQDAIKKACSENEKTIDASPGYIYGINGIFDGYNDGISGSDSAGWIISLNGWFLDNSPNMFSVGGKAGMHLKDGDEILVEYSMDGGTDVGNVYRYDLGDKVLSKLTFSKGTLDKQFDPVVENYYLNVDSETDKVKLSLALKYPENFIALVSTDGGKTFSVPGDINVADGTKIEVYCGTTTGIYEPNSQYATPVRIYSIVVKKDVATTDKTTTGKTDNDNTTKAETTAAKNENSPKTGDDFNAVPLIAIALCAAAVGGATLIRRKPASK